MNTVPAQTGGAKLPQALAPVGPRTARLFQLQTQDREFLPAALEILDTPPSTVAVSFIWLICAIFAAAIAWSYFGQLDIHAVVPGKIQPAGRAKVIQPLEPGRIVAVFVENGTSVKEGDILVELDPTETTADQERLTRDLESADAEVARRQSAIKAARLEVPAALPVEFKPDTSELVRRREEGMLAAELAQLAASRETLNAQLLQQLATQRRLNDSIAQRERLIALTKERVEMRETLIPMGAGSRALVIDALTQYETELNETELNETELTSLIGEKGQLQETTAAIETTRRKLVETLTQFISDQTQKLVDAERKRDQLLQELVKARSKNERMRLKAPVAGTVQQLNATAVGQVVAAGQPLMTITPLDVPLEIEALVLNKNIGFVKVGQPAIIKVEAFPFTRYGTIDGVVTKVSNDAVDMRSAPNLSDTSAGVKAEGTAPTSGSTRPEFAFPAIISLARRSIEVDGRQINLSPGMAVTVEIRTGTRRIIGYVLSPLREAVSTTAHER